MRIGVSLSARSGITAQASSNAADKTGCADFKNRERCSDARRLNDILKDNLAQDHSRR
jgi:hypothetical protein